MNADHPSADPGDDRRMPFLDHLSELRVRFRNSVLAVLGATALAYLFKAPLFSLMARPLTLAWAEMRQEARLPPLEIVYTSLVDGFMVLLKLSLLAGVFVASPVLFHQAWKFIAPGLYQRERRLALVFVISSVVLFVGGAVFAYVLILPASYRYFLSYSSDSMGVIKDVLGRQIDVKLTEAFTIRPMVTMDEYFSLTSMLLLVFGAVFELPLLLSVLALFGVVTAQGLWRFNRYAILLFFLVGAVLTPGDLVIGQIGMGVALAVLYNLSIVFAWFIAHGRHEGAPQVAQSGP